MQLAWHREDSGYLAATVAAAAVVAYVVFGNFGLFASPFSSPATDPGVFAVEPVLAAASDDRIDVEVRRVAAPRPDGPVPPAAPPKPARDVAKPRVAFITEPGTSFTATEPAVVEGLVEDATSGVRDVLVTFVASTGSKQTVTAKITCSDGRRRSCTWSAEAPAVVADYTVTAKASDRAGNRASAEPIEITVVNPGGPVEDVVEVVGRVPIVLETVVGGVLGLLR